MSEQPHPVSLEIDSIAVDPSETTSSDIHVDDIPDEIAAITRGLANQQPPSNPFVVLKAARWWYVHGRGTNDPVFQWAIEWTRTLATSNAADVELYDAFLDRLVDAGFAADRQALRTGVD